MNTPPTISLVYITAASGHIDPVFLKTPHLQDTALDGSLGCRVLAKVETQNPVGSFKGRGTELFAARKLSGERETVVCASADNFGQGLPRASVRRGHACVVFAAETANPVKVAA